MFGVLPSAGGLLCALIKGEFRMRNNVLGFALVIAVLAESVGRTTPETLANALIYTLLLAFVTVR